jgi:adenylate cyclase
MQRRLHLIVPALLLLLGLALRVADPPVLADLRLKLFDFFQTLKPREYVPAPVRIVDLDDESLEKLGQWPWPRVLLAQLVERLSHAGAAVIAFDIVFAEPDRTSPSRVVELWLEAPAVDEIRGLVGSLADHDAVFASAVGQAVVVTGFAGTDGGGGAAPAQKAGFASTGDDPTLFVPAYSGSVVTLPEIEAAAAGNGSLNFVPDRDGIVRRVPLLVSYKGTLYPQLAIEALRVAQGASTYVVKASGASGQTGFGEKTGITHVKVGRLVAPTDETGKVWLYDTGLVPQRTIPAWRVLSENFDPAEVAGMIVLVGTSAVGLLDIRATPLEPAMPGVEIHAELIEQLLLQTFLNRPDWADGAEILYLLSLGVLLIVLLPRAGAGPGAAVGALAVAAAVGFSWYAFVELRLLFAPLYPSLIVVLVYMSSTLISFMRTEAERHQVRGAFGRYLSPVLVERLAEDPSRLKLGGEMREMTLLFCDIRGFTTISEQLDAEGLTRLINRFLTPMTDVILSQHGAIDKYMGDCIMAYWNAPLDDPDHASNACLAALTMRVRLEQLNETLRREADEEGRKHIPIRVGTGLNTGVCCVGNMGSDQRFDYSVLGDNVNLASRLEGQSKTYGVDIVVGEKTSEAADGFAILELDFIRVKGKTVPVRIHTLLGDSALSEDAGFQALRREHADMIAAYRRQDWAGARKRLAACRGLDAGLGLGALYHLYEERCAAYEREPPGTDWDGVFIATTK